jgi:6-pyruvoyltetrahydropterin/6-carboxytetrahydropterin synthase
MPTLTLSVLFEFSASHRLYRPDLSEEENVKLFGKCSNPNGHGHTYTLLVNVTGAVDATSEMIIDAALLKDLVEREILHDVDHKDLNRDTPWLEGRVPTTEVVARAIFDRLADAVSKASGNARLASITLHETRRIAVTVTA